MNPHLDGTCGITEAHSDSDHGVAKHRPVPLAGSTRVRHGQTLATCNQCRGIIKETVRRSPTTTTFGWRHLGY